MKQRTVFFLSDQTGITAETLGRSLLSQFDNIKFRQVTVPFISTVDKARDVVSKINLTAKVEGCRPIVLSTLVLDELRNIIKDSEGLFLDFIDAFIGPLEEELGQKSSHTSGMAHGMADSSVYTKRIDAMNFALANDDGMSTAQYDSADVILIGVSRSGKTPTCLYLALQYGVYAANFPLDEEQLETGQLPRALAPYANKLFGLTIDADRLQQIRQERRPDSRYASPQQINYELRAAEGLYRKHGIASQNTTQCSIEEIASIVMDAQHIKRRVRM